MILTKNYGFKKRELTDSPPDITATEDNWDLNEKILKTHADGIANQEKQINVLASDRGYVNVRQLTNTDLNTIDSNGKYFVSVYDSNINVPHSRFVGVVEVTSTIWGNANQLAWNSHYDGQGYTRSLTKDGWTKWQQIATLDKTFKFVGEVYNENWNNFVQMGSYDVFDAKGENSPITALGLYSYGMLTVTVGNKAIIQRYISHVNTSVATRVGFLQPDGKMGWQPWRRIATTDKIEILNTDFKNGWVAYGGGLEPPSYSRVGNRVFCSGLIKDGTVSSGTLLFNLPIGFRPNGGTAICQALSNNILARLDIGTSGDVFINTGASYNYINLNGISFNVN